jgi:hypothetical protein
MDDEFTGYEWMDYLDNLPTDSSLNLIGEGVPNPEWTGFSPEDVGISTDWGLDSFGGSPADEFDWNAFNEGQGYNTGDVGPTYENWWDSQGSTGDAYPDYTPGSTDNFTGGSNEIDWNSIFSGNAIPGQENTSEYPDLSGQKTTFDNPNNPGGSKLGGLVNAAAGALGGGTSGASSSKTSTGSTASNPAASSTTALLGSLLKALGLGGANGIAGILGGGLDVASQLSKLFQTSDEGKMKQRAGQAYDNMKASADSIKAGMISGKIPPATAVKMLQNLAKVSATNMGQNPMDTYMRNSMRDVTAYINSIMGDAEASYGQSLGGIQDKTGGLSSAYSDPATQQDWMKTQLRNKMMGFEEGNKNLAGSPMESLFNKFDPYAEFDTAMGKVKSTSPPTWQTPSSMDLLKKKLEGI